jgi:hypothetical protein
VPPQNNLSNIVAYFSPIPKRSEKDALHADALLFVIVVEAVMGTAGAPFVIFAVFAVTAHAGQGFSKNLKPVFPDITETVLINVALHQFRSRFNVEASSYVTVCPDACGLDTRAALEEPVPDFALEIKA